MGVLDKKEEGKKLVLGKDIFLFQLISTENELLDRSKSILRGLKNRYKLTPKQTIDLIYKKSRYISIPITVLKTRLAPLESIVKYLKEEVNLSFNEIALFLNRDATTIWTSYRNAKRKRAERFVIGKIKFSIPLSVFSERRLSALDLIAEYLIEKHKLNYHAIAILLNKDDRTIWTCYHRAKKKREKIEKF